MEAVLALLASLVVGGAYLGVVVTIVALGIKLADRYFGW